jgi:hypothetical protein
VDTRIGGERCRFFFGLNDLSVMVMFEMGG